MVSSSIIAMTPIQPHPRTRSLSDSMARAKFIFDAPRDSSRRAALPRAVSTMDICNTATIMRDPNKDDDIFRDMAREQVDRETLRELARFFRETRPPITHDPSPMEDCFGTKTPGQNTRWSIRSLRRGHKGRMRPKSLRFSDSTVLKTTAAGYTYMAISLPPASQIGDRRHPLETQFSAFQSSGVESRNSLSSSNSQVLMSGRSSRAGKDSLRLSVSMTTAEPSVRSFMKLVDEWLEDQKSATENLEPAENATVMDTALETKIAEATGDEKHPDATPTPEITVEPAMVSSSGVSLKSPDNKSQPLAFPSSSLGAKRGSQKSPKLPQTWKKLENSNVKGSLQVPDISMPPDSPGFPQMLASMTFPSPPQSIPSHSASNSITSSVPGRSLATPPLAERSTAMSPPPSNLDERVVHPTRPLPKQWRSDGAFDTLVASQKPIPTSAKGHNIGPAELSATGDGVHLHDQETSPTITGDTPSQRGTTLPGTNATLTQRPSQDSSGLEEFESQRQSTVSTIDSSRQSATISNQFRHSLRSDTSATSDATATEETYGKRHPSHRYSVQSSTLGHESKRSETACSTRSVSSAGTGKTTITLAERRKARRARVRERLQRDSVAFKTDVHIGRDDPALADSVDSPVLGWFPQTRQGPAPTAHRVSQDLSSLARHLSPPGTPTIDSDGEGTTSHASRKPSSQGMTQKIPETVQEATTPVTPRAPASTVCSFSPIMVEETKPDPDPNSKKSGQYPPRPILSISPIMTVASIDFSPPSSILRPLSLLSNGSSPPNLPHRSSLRSDTKPNIWQRPFPVRVAKNSLELTVNTNAPTKCNSPPPISTPPSSPDLSSSRLGLPRPKPTSAPPSINRHPLGPSPWNTRQTRSLRSKECEWLTAHQRQTAEDWRLAALRDRMRRELLEGKDMEEDGEEAGAGCEEDGWRQPREKHRCRTLKALNANATTSNSTRQILTEAPRIESDDDKTPTAEASVERGAASSDADVEQRLLAVILPILESMDSTLKKLQRDSVGHRLSAESIDSPLPCLVGTPEGHTSGQSEM